MRSPPWLTLPLMWQPDPGSIAFNASNDTPPEDAPTPRALASMKPVNSVGTDGELLCRLVGRNPVGAWLVARDLARFQVCMT